MQRRKSNSRKSTTVTSTRVKKPKKNGNTQGSATVSLMRGPGVLCPSQISVVLRYAASESIAGGANAYGYITYSLNSPFDPLYSVGGGSCTGFAEWMALYDRYYCSSCTIKAQYINGGANMTWSYILPLRSAQAALGYTPTLDAVMESRDSVFRYNPGGSTSGIIGGWCLNMRVRPAAFEGLPERSNYDELSGDASTDPTIQPAAQVGFYASAVGLTFGFSVLIEYSVTFFRPKLLAT